MRAAIALGSNVGDRAGHLRRAAMDLLALPGVSEPARRSRLYETEPVGTEAGAGAFLNAVIEVEFEGDPAALLDELQAIEARLGRPSERTRNASRAIDLDLLYAGDLVRSSEAVTIPHPRLHRRRFVLQPLADLRPELILPRQTRSVAELLAALDDTARVEVSPEAWEP